MSAQQMAAPAQGFAYGAGASQRRPAQMVLTSGNFVQLQGADGTVLARAPRDLVQVDAPLGSAPRKVHFPDGALFESQDHAAIAAILGQSRGAMLHQMEAFRPRLIAVVALCLAATWALWRYGLDILVAGAIWATPPAIVAQIDQGTMQVIDFQMASPTTISPAEQARVTAIFDDLRAVLPEGDLRGQEFNLQFRQMDGVGPNAFALPGGTVVMTDAFVQEFGQDDILAGVLGHEIAHVVDQHGLKRLYRSLSVAVLIAFLAGDVGPILEDIVLEGNVLLSLSHSRAQERDADAFGLRLAADAGYDPDGLAVFFERLLQEYGAGDESDWLSTHPSSAERVRDIRAMIEALP
jgi:Zn-dependent protease with chaperone function